MQVPARVIETSPTVPELSTLSFDCRVRDGQVIKINNLVQRIIWTIRDWWRGGRLKCDNQEFDRLYQRISFATVTDTLDPKDVARLLHLKAKIEISGWARSLQANQNYAQFCEALSRLREQALQSVVEEDVAHKWLTASDEILKFSAYTNQFPLKRKEIPIGAILCYNANGRFAHNRIKGYQWNAFNYVQVLKVWLVRYLSGLPISHIKVALGNCEFLHLTKGDSNWRCNGKVEVESRPPESYNLSEEVLFPNSEAWSELTGDRTVEEFLEEVWKPAIMRSVGIKGDFKAITQPLRDPMRPENYNAAEQYNPDRPEGYSCSGLISASLASVGIDVTHHTGRKVDKATPIEYLTSKYYQLAYASEKCVREFRDTWLAMS